MEVDWRVVVSPEPVAEDGAVQGVVVCAGMELEIGLANVLESWLDIRLAAKVEAEYGEVVAIELETAADVEYETVVVEDVVAVTVLFMGPDVEQGKLVDAELIRELDVEP